jgi:uncharacterized protein YodC (DUF2158 family)
MAWGQVEMPKKSTFKAGETVKLNSGGPLMTILSIDRNGVKCAWSVKDDIKEKSFPSVALTKADRPEVLQKLLSAIAEAEGRASGGAG